MQVIAVAGGLVGGIFSRILIAAGRGDADAAVLAEAHTAGR